MQREHQLNLRVVGFTLSTLSGVTYLVCALAYLLFPGLTMIAALVTLFPGFSWSVDGVLLGLVEVVLYAWWAALIFVPTYNYLQRTVEAAPIRRRAPLAA